MSRPSLPLLATFNLALIATILAMITDAPWYVQLALAWSTGIAGDLLGDPDRSKRG
jgi:uncharacterized membrane protein YwaF